MNAIPRIALTGMSLESNAFAPPATEADFRERFYVEGEALLAEARQDHSVIPKEMSAFVRALDRTGPWTPVPLVLTGCQPSGPVDHGFFAATLDRILSALEAEAPLDGVYCANHGAMLSTASQDPDGVMLKAIRKVTGPECALIATLDLHTNVSRDMAANALLISYLTNPHVDMLERGEEAAWIMRALLAGLRPQSAFIRLPLVPASVNLLTASGPYGELIDYGQRRKREMSGAILNVSVTGNFAFSDSPKNGLAVTVTAREDLSLARDLAGEIATRAWAMRDRFRKSLTPLSEALAVAGRAAADPGSAAVIFSDAGDNPGGGGSGRTTELLQALVDAAVPGVIYGSFYDRELADEAHRLGEGAQFEAVFNRSPNTEFDQRYSCPAKVLRLRDGPVVGRRGLHAGRTLELGRCAALELGTAGLVAILISDRQQTADPVLFEMLGVDIGAARCVCVKSRGHFRAGFDEWFAPEQVYEIDTAGLTSPVLERFNWQGLARPVYPLDEETRWEVDVVEF